MKLPTLQTRKTETSQPKLFFFLFFFIERMTAWIDGIFFLKFRHATCVRVCVSAKVFLGTSKASRVSVFLWFYLSPFLLLPQPLCAIVLACVDVDSNWWQSGSGCDSHLGSASLLREGRLGLLADSTGNSKSGASVVVRPAGPYLLIGRLLPVSITKKKGHAGKGLASTY